MTSDSNNLGFTISENQVDYLREKYMNVCKQCLCVKPPRTHHCRKCGRCVLKMDHHCKWVSNCIGQRNLKLFIVFLTYNLLVQVSTFVSFLMRGIKCVLDENTCG